MSQRKQLLTLQEHQEIFFSSATISQQEGQLLWQKYSKYLTTEFPSPKTHQQWRLTGRDWIGYFPVSHRLAIVLEPKVELVNVFQLLAYSQPCSFFHYPGVVQCQSLPGLYQLVAEIFSHKILTAIQRELHSPYQKTVANLDFIRGRTDWSRSCLPRGKFSCHYFSQSWDNWENQLLLYTLHLLKQSSFCSPATQQRLRKAYRILRPIVSLRSFASITLSPHQLQCYSATYQLLLSIAFFFLHQHTPSLQKGRQLSPAFLMHMPSLFESFVAAWLNKNLPYPYYVKHKERLPLSQKLFAIVDLVVYHKDIEHPLAVLDVKYKQAARINTADIFQIFTYAQLKEAPQGILIYPSHNSPTLQEQVKEVAVITPVFDLQKEFAKAEEEFGRELHKFLEKFKQMF